MDPLVVINELKLSDPGELLRKFQDEFGIRSNIIETYNNWLEYGLFKQLSAKVPPPEVSGGSFTILSVNKIHPPMQNESKITPQHCRKHGINYMAEVSINVQFKSSTTNKITTATFPIGKIPIMLGSIACHLNKLTPTELVEIGECPNDPLGYFIIRGEKTIIIQEKLRVSSFMTYNADNKGTVESRITCVNNSGSTIVTIGIDKDVDGLEVGLNHLRRKRYPILILFHILGVNTRNAIKMISKFIHSDAHSQAKARQKLVGSMVQWNTCTSQTGSTTDEIVIEYIRTLRELKISKDGSRLTHSREIIYTPENIKTLIYRDIIQDLYSHVPTANIQLKAITLAYHAARMIEYQIGIRTIDSRDDWGNKRLESSARSMEQLVNGLWGLAIQNSTDGMTKQGDRMDAFKNGVTSHKLEEDFIKAFGTNAWGLPGHYAKENITEQLRRDTPLAVISQVGRVSAPVSRQGQMRNIREVRGDQLGYCCCTGDTLILLANGESKRIDQFDGSEVVITTNPDTLFSEPSTIHSLFRKMPTKVLEIKDDLGNSVRCDPEHPFLVQNLTSNVWTFAQDLKIDDLVYILEQSTLKLVKLVSITETEVDMVYDFTTTSENHSFYANGFLVKNCIWETPEGEGCGIIKNVAMTCWPSIDRPTDKVYKTLAKFTDLHRRWAIDSDINIFEWFNSADTGYNDDEFPDILMVNGLIIGVCNGPELRKELSRERRFGELDFDNLIYYNTKDRTLEIDTGASRPTRPLLVVDEKGDLVIDELDCWKSSIEDLRKNGSIENIDAREQHDFYIAMSVDQLRKRKSDWLELVKALTTLIGDDKVEELIEVIEEDSADPTADDNPVTLFVDDITVDDTLRDKINVIIEGMRTWLSTPNFDYCEIDPNAVVSLATSIICEYNKEQGPRTTYQASMGKQAQSQYHSVEFDRWESSYKKQIYPTRAIAETESHKTIGLDYMPAGDTLIVAIAAHPDNPEDGIVMTEEAAKICHRFCYIKKVTHKVELKGTIEDENFCRPEARKGEKQGRYSAIQADGFPKLDSLLNRGDCIVGRVRTVQGSDVLENASLFVGIGEEGYVDRVMVSNFTGAVRKVVKIKIRQIRDYIAGDKMACFTPEHQILTWHKGWIPISSVTTEDYVATLNEKQELQYSKPTEVQSYDYEGPMYEMISQQVEQTVTPNHRMYIQKRYDDHFTIESADKIFGKRVRHKKNATWSAPNQPLFNIPEATFEYMGVLVTKTARTVPMNEWLVFFGIWIAEGWADDKNVTFAANKPRVKKALDEVAEALGIKFSKCSGDKWYIHDRQLALGMSRLSVGAINKSLPEWCFILSQEQARILLESLMLGDGHKTKSTGSYRYYTSSSRLATDVQRLALHAGWSANAEIRSEAGSETVMKDGRIIKTNADAWVVAIIRTKNEPTMNHGHARDQSAQSEKWIPYKGKVYCCTVPSGVIYIQKNGKPSWSGNSRYSQKGTISRIVPSYTLPRVCDTWTDTAGNVHRSPNAGLVPDIMINPHSFPSRMTINKMDEMLASKAALYSGERVNGTTFRTFESAHWKKILSDNGMRDDGKEDMEIQTYTTDPVTREKKYTGKWRRLKVPIFVAPCYYQGLRHHVNDKMQYRSRGAVKPITHQPVRGRAREGGIRFGEMERDAEISHGAAAILQERLCISSDQFSMVMCYNCGRVAKSDYQLPKPTFKCNVCKCNSKFGVVKIPYAFKLVIYMLMACGIETVLDLVASDQKTEDRFLS